MRIVSRTKRTTGWTSRRGTLAAALAVTAALALPGAGAAQDYPTRPIRLLVGFTAGGPTDVPARMIATKLSAALGKPVVVENKPGAGSMLATNEMLSQPRDGHTLLACTYFDPVNTLLYKTAKYQVSDIQPVSLIARYDYMIAVPQSSPANSFAEFLAYAKQRPTALNYGHLGIGSTQNLLVKQIERTTGIAMTGITYKGAADAVREMVAGRLDFFSGPPLVVLPQYQAKKVKLIAVTGTARLSSAPEVPTLTESGVPLVAFAWLGICAGSGTPQPIIERLNRELKPILESEDYRSLVDKSGSVAAWSTPQQLQTIIDKSVADAKPVIEQFGLKMD